MGFMKMIAFECVKMCLKKFGNNPGTPLQRIGYCPKLHNQLHSCMLPFHHICFRILLLFFLIPITQASIAEHFGPGRDYYLSEGGNDAGSGYRSEPWQSIDRLNKQVLRSGDKVFFKAGETFKGTLVLDSNDRGKSRQPILISTYGRGKANINSGDAAGLTLMNSRDIKLENLHFTGSGRKGGNTMPGINISYSREISLDSLEVQGYQKAGLLIYNSSYIRATRIFSHDNGAAGIQVSGEKDKQDCYQVYIGSCRAENNPGDPTQLENHSGNGIVVGLCRRVTIEYCVATNNGWDMPRIGNGPVGIWAYEADSVVIQRCISFRNKTSVGGEDGGGYDLDGGVTNSFIQYCLSYENQGSAFGIFQYSGASDWYNNVIRFNISENDGLVSTARAGAYIWNGSNEAKQFSRCYFYNNVIFNTKGAVFNYNKESAHSEFYFCNNIFVGMDTLINGNYDSSKFFGNNWWSIRSGFNVDGIKDLKTWAAQKNKETLKGQLTGFETQPRFVNAGRAMLEDASYLKTFNDYKVLDHPEFLYNGIDLKAMFNIDSGFRDFNQKPAARNGVGAIF